MNQAIFFASSALKSCINKIAGGAMERLPFAFISFASSTTNTTVVITSDNLKMLRLALRIGDEGIDTRLEGRAGAVASAG
ncbi:MAG: hypothetical protein ABSE51_14440, partial [Terracidiphilus sp.]